MRLKRLGTAGFTIYELTVIAATIAVSTSMLGPAMENVRRTEQEQQAINSLRLIGLGQFDYLIQARVFAKNLPQLARGRHIDKQLATGTKQGYKFAIGKSKNWALEWNATALPVSKLSGRRSFYIDETTGVRETRRGRPNAKSDPVNEDPPPTATPGPLEELDRLQRSGVRTIRRLAKFAPGSTLVLDAQAIVDNSEQRQVIIDGFDANDDGIIEWEDLLGADWLPLARMIGESIQEDPGEVVGEDEDLERVLDRFSKRMLRDRELDCSEAFISGLDPSTAVGDPASLLEFAK